MTQYLPGLGGYWYSVVVFRQRKSVSTATDTKQTKITVFCVFERLGTPRGVERALIVSMSDCTLSDQAAQKDVFSNLYIWGHIFKNM